MYFLHYPREKIKVPLPNVIKIKKVLWFKGFFSFFHLHFVIFPFALFDFSIWHFLTTHNIFTSYRHYARRVVGRLHLARRTRRWTHRHRTRIRQVGIGIPRRGSKGNCRGQ